MNFFEWTTTQKLLGVTFRWEVLVLVFLVFPGPCLSNDDGDGRCSKEEEEPEGNGGNMIKEELRQVFLLRNTEKPTKGEPATASIPDMLMC